MTIPTPTAFHLPDFAAVAESFAQGQLEGYVTSLTSREEKLEAKEINDALWGTVSLSPMEVAVLDSPLFQRLRYVRQLGVVHWVYPGAVHTRFEHSLGVMQQVRLLAATINDIGQRKGLGTLIQRRDAQLLRLAALLHDVGHAAFSHVSEMAVQDLPALASLRTKFAREQRSESKSLSEMFAYYVVRSKAMRAFFSLLHDDYGSSMPAKGTRAEAIDEMVSKVSNAIIGKMIDARVPLLHELISGPFDADKLDYFVRDARMAGTPSVLDISRLLQKISVVELTSLDLPKELARSVQNQPGKHCLFGIKWSGIPTLDELQLARVLLYAKIYRHPKVIGVEQMVRSAITTVAPLAGVGHLLKFLYDHNDDVILAMDAGGLCKALGRDITQLTVEEAERAQCAASLLSDLRSRTLTNKAFQIESRYPGDELEQDYQQKTGLTSFIEQVEHPTYREDFRQKLITEMTRIVTALGQPTPSRISLEASVAVHHVIPTPGGSQIARAYLLPTVGKPLAFREYIVNRVAWADSYMTNQPRGFVFAPDTLADVAFVAVEMLIRIIHGVRLPPSALEASKRRLPAIKALKERLAKAGYYKGTPYDVRPEPERLTVADIAQAASAFAPTLQAYQAPEADEAQGRKASLPEYKAVARLRTGINGGLTLADGLTNEQLDAAAGRIEHLLDGDRDLQKLHGVMRTIAPEDRVRNWLRQFDDDEHIDGALRLLEGFRMIGRKDTIGGLRSFVEANPDFRGANVVPFGSARDSGAVQGYFAADLAGSHIAGCKAISELDPAEKNKTIIFVDDFTGTGKQARDVLVAGFGVTSLRSNLNEQRDMFGDHFQEYLRGAKIGFAFTAAWNEGLKTVRQTCSELGLEATVYGHIPETDIPYAFSGDAAAQDPAQLAAFKGRCADIGRQIVLSQATGESVQQAQDKAAERALGYGNRAMLLGTPFNVPSQTMTLIWGNGIVDGLPWEPLMRRRKKR